MTNEELEKKVDVLHRALQDMQEQIRILTSLCEQNARAIKTLSDRMDFNRLSRGLP